MGRSMFTIKGNICSDKVRLGRALQKPPITQEELAQRIQFMGMEDMTPLAKALHVSMEWLVSDTDEIKIK